MRTAAYQFSDRLVFEDERTMDEIELVEPDMSYADAIWTL